MVADSAENGTLAAYLLVADEGHLEVTHEPCGATLLVTLRVHLDTLARIAREHECRVFPPEVTHD